MTYSYTGKRKGISLVEMTIAVILFGLLAAVTLFYYKNLFNTDLTSKKARVAALMEQGYQLSGAYDVYVAQMGTTPTAANLIDFNASNVMILRTLPRDIREMTTTGWELNTTAIAGHDVFRFPLDLNGTSYLSKKDDELYCAIFNRELNTTVELNATNNISYGTLAANYALYQDAFCYSEDNGTGGYKHWIMIVK